MSVTIDIIFAFIIGSFFILWLSTWIIQWCYEKSHSWWAEQPIQVQRNKIKQDFNKKEFVEIKDDYFDVEELPAFDDFK